MTSSPLRPGAGASLEEELAYYKRQYEQLETDLADFQASSKELEEQLEKDVDVAEKKERKLKEQVEKLGFEVEEWKGKHKQAKTEANNAQNVLQKEITSIREQHRSVQLKLRDIEVANDDYETQARNTTSSLEDLESKLNISIERGVLLEDEVKTGEAEREALRIENQRLRDELGDLKIESEITLEKLRLSGKTIETLRSRKPGNLAVQSLRATSPASEASGITPYSPTMSTPPPKSETGSDMPTPPSPPLSDEAATTGKNEVKTPLPFRRRSLIPDVSATPRLTAQTRPFTSRHSRGPSLASTTSHTSDARAMRPPVSRNKIVSPPTTASGGLPRSESLHQMKSLRLRMQKIEERVQSARSKLPPTRDTIPRASPRTGAIVPASVTMRRTSKRESSVANNVSDSTNENGAPARRESHVKRLSYGIPRPASRSSTAGDRPPSRASILDRPPSAAGITSDRPVSRASILDRPPSVASRPSSRMSFANGNSTRPESRASAHGSGIDSRPRSSMSGSVTASTPRSHRPSASISELRRRAADGEDSGFAGVSRRTTFDRSTPLPTLGTFARRQSGTISKAVGRRTSVPSITDRSMKPPPARQKVETTVAANTDYDESELGETY